MQLFTHKEELPASLRERERERERQREREEKREDVREKGERMCVGRELQHTLFLTGKAVGQTVLISRTVVH